MNRIKQKYFEQIIQSYLCRSEQKNSTIAVQEIVDIETLGKYICALSNYAAFHNLPYAYAIWGIDPVSRLKIGTKFLSDQIELQKLLIKANYSLQSIIIDNFTITVLEVQRATQTTTQFNGVEYFVSDNSVCELYDMPECEIGLREKLKEKLSFEQKRAKDNVSADDLIQLLDYNKLFDMLSITCPDNLTEIVAKLVELGFVKEKNTGKYIITNLGALLLARRLKYFHTVEYKAVRVIKYDGNDVTCPATEQIGGKGYIVGFEGLIKFIIDLLPSHEIIENAIRRRICDYPEIAIRELVANAIIHQDLTELGSPVVSVFNNHIDIINPGTPLISHDRFIDSPSYSRNESLAIVMRKVGICEGRGSGYDKVIEAMEKYKLPVPLITDHEGSTKVTLYLRNSFDSMTKDERISSCYAHVCLNYVRHLPANNTSLRTRFGLEESEKYKISRVYKETIQKGLIKSKDGTGMKNREYIPYWASDTGI